MERSEWLQKSKLELWPYACIAISVIGFMYLMLRHS
jgi:hypothetical protein